MFKKLDAAFKRMWVDALRSGKYKQTRHTLRKNDVDGTECFCVLGVACDLLNPNGWAGNINRSEELGYNNKKLSDKACNLINLDFDAQRSLFQQNDAGASFETLADFIENRL